MPAPRMRKRAIRKGLPMANFQGHLTAGVACGIAYGAWGTLHLQMGW